jgi:hypothetical protein
MPVPEVPVAEFRMAFTASWIAVEVLVELEELDCPRSSLSDSVLLEPKEDRSEVIPLVLISISPLRPASERRRLLPCQPMYRWIVEKL